MRTCKKCGEEKPEDQFARHQCKSCRNAYSREHYRKNRQAYLKKAKDWNQQNHVDNRNRIRDFKANTGCLECGITDPDMLTFDHVDRNTKDYNIANMAWGHSWERILAEIKKCEVLCFNHHMKRERTREQTMPPWSSGRMSAS